MCHAVMLSQAPGKPVRIPEEDQGLAPRGSRISRPAGIHEGTVSLPALEKTVARPWIRIMC